MSILVLKNRLIAVLLLCSLNGYAGDDGSRGAADCPFTEDEQREVYTSQRSIITPEVLGELIAFHNSARTPKPLSKALSVNAAAKKLSTQVLNVLKDILGYKKHSFYQHIIEVDLDKRCQFFEQVCASRNERSFQSSLERYDKALAYLILGLLYYENDGVVYSAENAAYYLRCASVYLYTYTGSSFIRGFYPLAIALIGFLYMHHDWLRETPDHEKCFQLFSLAGGVMGGIVEEESFELKDYFLLLFEQARKLMVKQGFYTCFHWAMEFEQDVSARENPQNRFKLLTAGLLLNNLVYLLWAADRHYSVQAAYELGNSIMYEDVKPSIEQYKALGSSTSSEAQEAICLVNKIIINSGKAIGYFNKAIMYAEESCTDELASSLITVEAQYDIYYRNCVDEWVKYSYQKKQELELIRRIAIDSCTYSPTNMLT